MKAQDFLNLTQKDEVKYWIEHNLANFLEKSNGSPQIVTQDGFVSLDATMVAHIIDYLNSDAAPKRLKAMSVDEALKSTEKWNKSLVKRNKGVFEDEEDTEVFAELKDGYRLVQLKGDKAFKREGAVMGHCVASYYGRESEVGKIFSIRSSSNEPHCTIQLTNEGRIQQIKGKQNRAVIPKYVPYVFEALDHLKAKVDERELENLGYYAADGQVKALLNEYSEDLKDEWKIVVLPMGEFAYYIGEQSEN